MDVRTCDRHRQFFRSLASRSQEGLILIVAISALLLMTSIGIVAMKDSRITLNINRYRQGARVVRHATEAGATKLMRASTSVMKDLLANSMAWSVEQNKPIPIPASAVGYLMETGLGIDDSLGPNAAFALLPPEIHGYRMTQNQSLAGSNVGAQSITPTTAPVPVVVRGEIGDSSEPAQADTYASYRLVSYPVYNVGFNR